MTPAALDRHFSPAGREAARLIAETGDALADSAYERGARLTAEERQALTHQSMYGSDGYPVRKLGKKWTYDHAAAPQAPLYLTKRDAVRAWEILIAKWIRMSGLEAQARAMQELAGARR